MKPLRRLKSKLIGQNKERLAERWAQASGYEVLARNHHCRGGEIDLIGFNAHLSQLVFFEVKYRRSIEHGHPAEFVTPQQQARILKCAQHYLLTHAKYQNCQIQFDILTFIDNQTEPDRIENAFGL